MNAATSVDYEHEAGHCRTKDKLKEAADKDEQRARRGRVRLRRERGRRRAAGEGAGEADGMLMRAREFRSPLPTELVALP